jgi:hypothetical protein
MPSTEDFQLNIKKVTFWLCNFDGLLEIKKYMVVNWNIIIIMIGCLIVPKASALS